MGIKEIREIYLQTPVEKYPDFIKRFETDERSGIQKLVVAARVKEATWEAEKKRTYGLMEYERKYENCRYICGIDEVGRGPLAGPVVAAAVILPKDMDIYYLDDSKKLSSKKREELYDEIMEKAVAVGIGSSDEKCIDAINIRQANYLAMREAIGKLGVKPDILLVDAEHIPDVDIMQESIIKGDAKSVSIAAASIIAKVTRDRYMEEIDALYPEYGFAVHKGYGTKKHRDAIKAYGPCEIHRRSFLKKITQNC